MGQVVEYTLIGIVIVLALYLAVRWGYWAARTGCTCGKRSCKTQSKDDERDGFPV